MQSVDSHFKFDKTPEYPGACTANAVDTISESGGKEKEQGAGREERSSQSDGLSREEAELLAEYEHLKILKLNIQQ